MPSGEFLHEGTLKINGRLVAINASIAKRFNLMENIDMFAAINMYRVSSVYVSANSDLAFDQAVSYQLNNGLIDTIEGFLLPTVSFSFVYRF